MWAVVGQPGPPATSRAVPALCGIPNLRPPLSGLQGSVAPPLPFVSAVLDSPRVTESRNTPHLSSPLRPAAASLCRRDDEGQPPVGDSLARREARVIHPAAADDPSFWL
ncbi:hypothetical protein ACP70R_002102 [Stipagrostis hirtigluma subsp. patula]